MSELENDSDQPASKSGKGWIFKAATWAVTLFCFYLVYTRTEATAAREGLTVVEYLLRFFSEADWTVWLMVMIPYSLFFFSVDSHATWRAIRWFNAPQLRLTQVLPIRASAYILSLVNEQVGKGAMSLYLAKRHDVPGWQALSTMVMLGLMEIYQLLFFSGIGVLIYYELVQGRSGMVRDGAAGGLSAGYLANFPEFVTRRSFAPFEKRVQYSTCCCCCLKHQT